MGLIDDIRVDIGDDEGAIPSGVPSHELLSTSHADTVAGPPTPGGLIIGSSTAWSALPSGAETEVLMVTAGSVAFYFGEPRMWVRLQVLDTWSPDIRELWHR